VYIYTIFTLVIYTYKWYVIVQWILICNRHQTIYLLSFVSIFVNHLPRYFCPTNLTQDYHLTFAYNTYNIRCMHALLLLHYDVTICIAHTIIFFISVLTHFDNVSYRMPNKVPCYTSHLLYVSTICAKQFASNGRVCFENI